MNYIFVFLKMYIVYSAKAYKASRHIFNHIYIQDRCKSLTQVNKRKWIISSQQLEVFFTSSFIHSAIILILNACQKAKNTKTCIKFNSLLHTGVTYLWDVFCSCSKLLFSLISTIYYILFCSFNITEGVLSF